jgi:glycosyltransferase involved in cell wall biosynthesis
VTLLFASGTPHLPQLVGGLEVNTHHLALEMKKRGLPVAVLSKLSVRDLFGASKFVANKIRRRDVSVDRGLGYPVYRSFRPWRDVRGLAAPRIVVVQNGNMVEIGRTFREKGVPSVAYLHGFEFDTGPRAWQGSGQDLPFSAYIANSSFTAARFERRFGIRPSIIPPVFISDLYRTTGQGTHVTFVNPIPAKGLTLALEVARLCPDIPFLFARSWPLSAREEAELKRSLKALPNVSLIQRSSNMSEIYARTRILMAPSQWEETWGRVVSEAQISGIPVLATTAGALPESVGPGGILLERDASPSAWASELRNLWSDRIFYEAKRSAALAYAARPDLDIDRQISQLISILERVSA